MPVTTVQTANGPVLVDEDGIEAWGGEVLADAPKPPKIKRGKQAAVAPTAVKQLDGTDKWVVVDDAGERTDELEYDSEEAALLAVIGE